MTNQKRSPDIPPWISPAASMPSDAAPSSSAVNAGQRSLDLPSFQSPTTAQEIVGSPQTSAQTHIPQYSPPSPQPTATTAAHQTMAAAQAQRLSTQLRQKQRAPWSRSAPNFAGRRRPKPPRSIGRRLIRRSPSDRPDRRRPALPPLRRTANPLDDMFRGKMLLWLVGAWAIFWLIGGVALVGLLNTGSSAPPSRPFMAGNQTGAQSTLSQSPRRRGNLESFPNTAPIIDGGSVNQGSGPPVLPVAIALIICCGGGWLRLQRFRSGS